MEAGESLEEAVKREVFEEVGIAVDIGEQLFQQSFTDGGGNETIQTFFSCNYAGGDIGTGKGSEMVRSNDADFYGVTLVGVDEILSMDIVPTEFKQALIERMT